jgi:RND family efflux transporter MFP subunit
MNRLTALAVSTLLLMLTGCGGSEQRPTNASTAPAARVSTVDVQFVELPVIYEAPGTVRAQTTSTVSSKVMGYVRDVKVQPGDRVTPGQLLVLIDARDLESAVLQAKAAEQEAHSGIAEADNGIAAAQAQLELAQVTYKRMDGLFQKKSISNQEYDEARARLRAAEAAQQMAVSKRAQLDARISQAKQGVESASVTRSYSEIRAPFAGVVTDKRVEAGQMATPGTPLLTIEQTGVYRLEAPVEASMLNSVRLGQRVTVSLESSDQLIPGKVSEIVPAIDPSSRSFLVKVALPSSPSLRSGLFGRLRLSRGLRRSIVAPSNAIYERGELHQVFVVQDGLARTSMITVGQSHDGKVEVLSGLRPGDKVISPLPANMMDGSKVEVRP